MAETTAIQWTDATVNFWWGCTKVGPGCDHCYAEAWSKRTGENIWGVGAPRRKIKSALKMLYRFQNEASWWAADHYIGKFHDHPRRRVFLQSMSDLFDAEVPTEWFSEAWGAITACDSLELQIVTKRLPNIEKRLSEIGASWPRHAGLIISVVNQAEADRDIPRLLALKAKLGIPWVGLSMEPMLGPVNIEPWLNPAATCQGCDDGDGYGNRCSSDRIPRDEQCPWKRAVQIVTEHGPFSADGQPASMTCDVASVDWVIVGGESGPGARPMHPAWARSLRDQCAEAGVPFLFKQWGEHVAKPAYGATWPDGTIVPSDLEPVRFERVGKKVAGRLLDGVEHNGFPKVVA